MIGHSQESYLNSLMHNQPSNEVNMIGYSQGSYLNSLMHNQPSNELT